MVGVQKLGKDPMEAAQITLEGDGPALFAGWAGKDDGWSCRDMGCGCGFEYAYDLGEPMGMRWPTALIQVTAVSEDATANTYSALRPMIEDARLQVAHAANAGLTIARASYEKVGTGLSRITMRPPINRAGGAIQISRRRLWSSARRNCGMHDQPDLSADHAP